MTERTYTLHEVASFIAELFGDNCACNFNGIDDWLPFFCAFSQTSCPDPGGVACWEQYVMHKDKKDMDKSCASCRHDINSRHCEAFMKVSFGVCPNWRPHEEGEKA